MCAYVCDLIALVQLIDAGKSTLFSFIQNSFSFIKVTEVKVRRARALSIPRIGNFLFNLGSSPPAL